MANVDSDSSEEHLTNSNEEEDHPKPTKKAKLVDLQTLAASAWGHYRNLLENDNTNDDDETEQLQELCTLLQPHIAPFKQSLASIRNSTDMLPILASVVYFHLASGAISRYLAAEATTGGTGHEQTRLDLAQAQEWIDLSIHYFPCNSVALSTGANLGRMSFTLPEAAVLEWYEQAALHARTVRRETLRLLETGDYGIDTDMVKEWMELLLLSQVAGVEYVVEEDDEEEEEEDAGHFSASSVEGTSRFMAAMLFSRAGNHDRAFYHLRKFSLSHRLHPNVWEGVANTATTPTISKPRLTATTAPTPLSFRGGVLPPKLYQRMSEFFAPDAAYWKETGYANRGYYSFFADIDTVKGTSGRQPTTNLIHDVVVNHLLPLAKQALNDDEAASQICGYEWWAHTRLVKANLGHVLHFDTDACFLADNENIVHPLVSSVLYITGDETTGATIVLDQTPQCETVAHLCWRSAPQPNSYMVFPGNLLHGVLPCRGQSTAETPNDATPPSNGGNMKVQWTPATATNPVQHRLTFMVGFKTRRVPDQRKKGELYGPCAPLPPADTESWAKELQHGYLDNGLRIALEPRQQGISMQELPGALPAWEDINRKAVGEQGVNEGDNGEPPLEFPRAIDHQFFVNGAPQCFRDSLFDKDESD
jgi:hypothetical protein